MAMRKCSPSRFTLDMMKPGRATPQTDFRSGRSVGRSSGRWGNEAVGGWAWGSVPPIPTDPLTSRSVRRTRHTGQDPTVPTTTRLGPNSELRSKFGRARAKFDRLSPRNLGRNSPIFGRTRTKFGRLRSKCNRVKAPYLAETDQGRPKVGLLRPRMCRPKANFGQIRPEVEFGPADVGRAVPNSTLHQAAA